MPPPHQVPGVPYPERGASAPAARPWGAQGGSFLQLRPELATLSVPGTQNELSPAKHSLCHVLSALWLLGHTSSCGYQNVRGLYPQKALLCGNKTQGDST